MNTFLNFIYENWDSLIISFLIVIIGFFISKWFVSIPLRWIFRRTATTLDDALIKSVKSPLSALVFVIFLQIASLILLPLFPDLSRELTNRFFFTLYLIIGTIIIFRVINTFTDWFSENLPENVDEKVFIRVLPITKSFARIIVIAIAITTLLSYLGVDISAIVASLGVAGLAVSLAARETIEDLIGGIFIVFDQPFRLGDRIDLQGLDTWGDVEEIGLRTCRIRTRDNRMVIIPNATISRSQIVNYSYPDPQYRIQMDIEVGNNTDINTLRRVVKDTMRNIEGVLPEKPVDALYIQMGESGMIFRIRWWIESYVDTRRMFDAVNTALQRAFNETGIVTPYPTQTINFQIDEANTERISRILYKDN